MADDVNCLNNQTHLSNIPVSQKTYYTSMQIIRLLLFRENKVLLESYKKKQIYL